VRGRGCLIVAEAGRGSHGRRRRVARSASRRCSGRHVAPVKRGAGGSARNAHLSAVASAAAAILTRGGDPSRPETSGGAPDIRRVGGGAVSRSASLRATTAPMSRQHRLPRRAPRARGRRRVDARRACSQLFVQERDAAHRANAGMGVVALAALIFPPSILVSQGPSLHFLPAEPRRTRGRCSQRRRARSGLSMAGDWSRESFFLHAAHGAARLPGLGATRANRPVGPAP
jgi:hypothetical protein